MPVAIVGVSKFDRGEVQARVLSRFDTREQAESFVGSRAWRGRTQPKVVEYNTPKDLEERLQSFRRDPKPKETRADRERQKAQERFDRLSEQAKKGDRTAKLILEKEFGIKPKPKEVEKVKEETVSVAAPPPRRPPKQLPKQRLTTRQEFIDSLTARQKAQEPQLFTPNANFQSVTGEQLLINKKGIVETYGIGGSLGVVGRTVGKSIVESSKNIRGGVLGETERFARDIRKRPVGRVQTEEFEQTRGLTVSGAVVAESKKQTPGNVVLFPGVKERVDKVGRAAKRTGETIFIKAPQSLFQAGKFVASESGRSKITGAAVAGAKAVKENPGTAITGAAVVTTIGASRILKTSTQEFKKDPVSVGTETLIFSEFTRPIGAGAKAISKAKIKQKAKEVIKEVGEEIGDTTKPSSVGSELIVRRTPTSLSTKLRQVEKEAEQKGLSLELAGEEITGLKVVRETTGQQGKQRVEAVTEQFIAKPSELKQATAVKVEFDVLKATQAEGLKSQSLVRKGQPPTRILSRIEGETVIPAERARGFFDTRFETFEGQVTKGRELAFGEARFTPVTLSKERGVSLAGTFKKKKQITEKKVRTPEDIVGEAQFKATERKATGAGFKESIFGELKSNDVLLLDTPLIKTKKAGEKIRKEVLTVGKPERKVVTPSTVEEIKAKKVRTTEGFSIIDPKSGKPIFDIKFGTEQKPLKKLLAKKEKKKKSTADLELEGTEDTGQILLSRPEIKTKKPKVKPKTVSQSKSKVGSKSKSPESEFKKSQTVPTQNAPREGIFRFKKPVVKSLPGSRIKPIFRPIYVIKSETSSLNRQGQPAKISQSSGIKSRQRPFQDTTSITSTGSGTDITSIIGSGGGISTGITTTPPPTIKTPPPKTPGTPRKPPKRDRDRYNIVFGKSEVKGKNAKRPFRGTPSLSVVALGSSAAGTKLTKRQLEGKEDINPYLIRKT